MEKSKADLRLDQIDVQQWNDPSLLNDIYTAIESGEMPPEDASKKPTDEDRRKMHRNFQNPISSKHCRRYCAINCTYSQKSRNQEC